MVRDFYRGIRPASSSSGIRCACPEVRYVCPGLDACVRKFDTCVRILDTCVGKLDMCVVLSGCSTDIPSPPPPIRSCVLRVVRV